jgi:uncharacterized protein YbjT (DUF2867 family)
MNVGVAGGTGLLGSACVAALLDAGHSVRIASRSPHRAQAGDDRLSWVRADATQPSTLTEALRGLEVLVDAVQFPGSPIEKPKQGLTFERVDLGGTRNLVDAAKAAGVGLYVGISGAGAAPDAAFKWQRFKWDEEEYIKASGLEYVIFRPSWIFGPRDVSLNRFLGFARWLPFVPVIGNGKTRINPLFIDDVARHVAAAVNLPAARNRVFEIGGPKVLTMDEVIRAALRASGKRRPLLHNPKILMKAIAAVIQHAPGRPLTPDAVDFITMDGVTDVTALQKTFGLPLTSLEDGLSTYLKR